MHWLQVLLADTLTPEDLSLAEEGINPLWLAGAVGRVRREEALVICGTEVFVKSLRTPT